MLNHCNHTVSLSIMVVHYISIEPLTVDFSLDYEHCGYEAAAVEKVPECHSYNSHV